MSMLFDHFGLPFFHNIKTTVLFSVTNIVPGCEFFMQRRRPERVKRQTASGFTLGGGIESRGRSKSDVQVQKPYRHQPRWQTR